MHEEYEVVEGGAHADTAKHEAATCPICSLGMPPWLCTVLEGKLPPAVAAFALFIIGAVAKEVIRKVRG